MTTMTTRPRTISAAECAKLVRAALKDAFPGMKFSVTSKTYSGGAIVNVRWMDGPTTKEVDAAAGQYTGSTFDGYQDLTSYHNSILNGETVWFEADAISTERTFSADFLRRRAESVAHRHGCEVARIEVNKWGHAEIIDGWDRVGDDIVRDLVMQAAYRTRAAWGAK